ncbi:MAG: hypothetical protein AAF196_17430 [Planctomycetota bacterium]
MRPISPRPLVFRAAVSVVLLAGSSTAQSQVVNDINSFPTPRSGQIQSRAERPPTLGQYQPFVEVSGEWYFTASNPGTGRELWKTDGTGPGTSIVTDLVPGREASDPNSLWRGDFAAGPRLMFAARTANGTSDLFSTDGTAAGTVSLGAFPRGGRLARVGNLVLFDGGEPWITDGSVAGTQLLLELEPGAADPTISAIVEEPQTNRAFFTASTSALGNELWVTDGTPGGTQLVLDISAGSASTPIGQLVAHNGLMFFSGPGGLWRSDGTATGTFLLLGVRNIDLCEDAAIGSRMFFVANSPATGTELYETDGTVAGTFLSADFRPGAGGSFPRALHANGNTLFLQLNTLTGSESAAFQNGALTPLTPPGVDFDAFAFRGAGPITYIYRSPFGGAGAEVWRTDGTVAGTQLVADLVPGPESSTPANFTPINGTDALFVAADPIRGRELWRTDGTLAGTTFVAETDPGITTASSLTVSFPTVLHGELLCVSAESVPGVGLEPHLLRAGDTSATPLGDLRAGPESSFPLGFTSISNDLGETIVFSARDDTNGVELWGSDGTFAGTQLLLDINPGVASSSPESFLVHGDECYFIATTANGPGIWKTDGSTTGTVRVSPLEVEAFCIFNGQVVFGGDDGTQVRLYATDGTPGGAVPLAATALDSIEQLIPDGDQRIFGACRAQATGREAYVFDSQGNPSLASDLRPGSPSGITHLFGVFDGRALLAEFSGSGGLWTTDGTLGSVQRLGDRGSISIGQEATYFTNDSGTYITDGTVAGTVRVADGSRALLTVGPGCYCSVRMGFESIVQYVQPGQSPQVACTLTSTSTAVDPSPYWYAIVGGELWFAAEHPDFGNEPQRLLNPPGAYVTPLGGSCGGNFATLESDRAVFGNTITIEGQRASTAGGFLLLSSPTSGALPFPGLVDCGLRIDTSSAITLTGITTSTWSTTLSIPNRTALDGLEVNLQAVFLAVSGGAAPLDTSDAVRLLLGR